MISLGIDPHLPAIVASARSARRLILVAPPGVGKTTRVPPALADAIAPDAGAVVVLEPRRLAARAAATRVAAERGGRVGEEIGYQVRHDRRIGKTTRVRYVTEGVLVRQILSDPFLDGVAAVVLDEFHERHLEGDLALAMLCEIQETVRPELLLVVASATLDIEPLRGYLGETTPVEAVDAVAHPVEVVHADRAERTPLADRIVPVVHRALRETDGDVLVFLPGAGEIRGCQKRLESGAGLGESVDVVPLHGSLEAGAQDRAVAPATAGRRKVVLATNIAESSLTLPGVTAVVDSGQARVLRHDPRHGIDRLQIERISRASATQRAGRAGRTGPGRCYRLWSLAEERSLTGHDTPEVRRIDIAGAELQLRAFTGGQADRFRWFEPPTDGARRAAQDLLEAVGALAESGALTPTGQRLLDLPLHPRLGRLMLEAERRGASRMGALVAALLSERDVGARRGSDGPSRGEGTAADLEARVELLVDLEVRDLSPGWCRSEGLDPMAARGVLQARDQMLRSGRLRRGGDDSGDDGDSRSILARLLLAGFADRVACRREGLTATMVGGRGLALTEQQAEWFGHLFVAVAVRDRGVRSAGERSHVEFGVPIERAWLEALGDGLVHQHLGVRFDEQRRKVEPLRQTRFVDLVLDERLLTDRDSSASLPNEAVESVLLTELLRKGPWRHIEDDGPVHKVVARIDWLRRTDPDLELPEIDEASVAATAARVAAPRRGLSGLRGGDVASGILDTLAGNQRAALQRFAPTRVDLPSGRSLEIDYSAEAGPTIGARLQEFFGQSATPTIGARGIPLVVHLWAPNSRPVQITSDLASFWSQTYPKIRLELRRRYPKHAWPEDPLTAKPPERRARAGGGSRRSGRPRR